MTEAHTVRGSTAKAAGNRGKGRQKGVPNKVTRELKAMILGALEDAGGQKYLTTQAKQSPAAFLTLLGKVLPSEIKAEHTGPNGEPIQTADVSVFSALPKDKREAVRKALIEALK